MIRYASAINQFSYLLKDPLKPINPSSNLIDGKNYLFRAHSVILEIAKEGGILFLLIVYIFVGKSLKDLSKKNKYVFSFFGMLILTVYFNLINDIIVTLSLFSLSKKI